MTTVVAPYVRADAAAPKEGGDPSSTTGSTGRRGTRNLRLFLAGQGVFQTGTWVQLVAQSWFALELSGRGTTLGWLATATFGPILVLSPWTGVVADRFDRRRLLLVTHGLAALQAAVLGGLVLADAVGVPLLYILALVHGLVYAVESPTRRAFVAEVVDGPMVIKATSLASAVSAGAMVVGPAVAGVLILRFSLGAAFVANTVACLVALVMLTKVQRKPPASDRPARWRGQARAGLQYVWEERELRVALMLTGAVTTFGFNHHVVIPVLARRTFGGGAGTYTVLVSAMAAGAVVGAMAASRRRSVDLGSLRRGAVAFGVAMTAAAVAPNLATAVVVAVLTGATGLWFICRATSLLQVRAAPEMRGRVMALSAVVMLGGAPVGGPIVGWLCEHLGPRWGLASGAVAALLAGVRWRSSAARSAAGPSSFEAGAVIASCPSAGGSG